MTEERAPLAYSAGRFRSPALALALLHFRPASHMTTVRGARALPSFVFGKPNV
jgi:hypothetical protein